MRKERRRERRDERKPEREESFDREAWTPLTGLGRDVKAGRISSIDAVIDSGRKIMEREIVDALMPKLQVELLMIGQAKGKFGGGQRRVFKQTQKKTNEGNKPSFSTIAAVGNGNGYVGIGAGKARETVPAREKAVRNAKRSIMRIRRGCGSWQCGCGQPHSIPFAVEGKTGSVRLRLMPAPRGTGLRVEKECQKVLALAGIRDIWSDVQGQTRTKSNLIKSCIAALRQLGETKIQHAHIEVLGIREGGQQQEAAEEQ